MPWSSYILTFKHQKVTRFSPWCMVHYTYGVIYYHIPSLIELILRRQRIDYIPDSLYMFLNLILGGYHLLEDEVDGDHNDNHDSFHQATIHNIAQDLVYTARGDKYLAPKHVEMGSTLHQKGASKFVS